MASSINLLDYALFQLTPTRTRFDLVLFSGGKTEKLASGLFEPSFHTSNLLKIRFAEVGTPSNSAHPPAMLLGSLKPLLRGKGELERHNDIGPEENSKIQLQRLLETRKTLLRKEQAMAYARGLVAGFEVHNIDDLISFADAFGASRLREACINFKELCKKKHGDGLWMEELAAMEACPPSELSLLGTSGIILNNDASGLNPHIILTLPKVMCQMDPQMHQEPSTTSSIPRISIPNAGYPSSLCNGHAVASQSERICSSEKEKFLNKKGLEHSGEDGEPESSNSEVGSDSDSYMQRDKRDSSTDASRRKKHRKKSSKTVVIRNINYIAPKRRMGKKPVSLMNLLLLRISLMKIPSSKSDSGLEDLGDGVVSNSSEAGQTNENWDAFQNLLMKDEEANVNGVARLHPMDVPDEHFTVKSLGDGTALANNSAMDLELEKVTKQRMAAGDSFVVTQRDGGSEDQDGMKDIESVENLRPVMKRRDSIDEDLLIPQRMDESRTGLRVILSATESSIIKPGNREDWLVISHSGKPENQTSINEDIIFNGDCMSTSERDYLNVEKGRKNVAIDDSFMIHDRPAVDDLCDSQWKTDISMAADLNLSSQPENGIVKENHEVLGGYEPNDMCVVLERDSD
ncbi:hypothetical protein GH714_002021 [Hevea brasiliensis]|uniref:Uncharacterized protein n=1 Tax=Hevea brasiliensis TaxID=3981 RepID=A0A6A6LZL1_HEVBR|nr:hypothetical protein GH714_002021 [Hevea brasiliensis]